MTLEVSQMNRERRLVLVVVLAVAVFIPLSWSAAWAGPLDTVDFPPAYPSGGNYDAFTATLPGLGLLLDGTTNRCDTDAEAGAEIAASVFTAIEAAEFACAALPPAASEVCYGVILVNSVVQVANEIAKSQCAFQDGLIDGAEIEAAYENSLIIHDNLIEHDLNLSNHDAEIKVLLAAIQAKVDENGQKLDVLLGGQSEMIRLIHTPSGRRASDYYLDACSDGDGCVWNDR
jgi:hypothetical protein